MGSPYLRDYRYDLDEKSAGFCFDVAKLLGLSKSFCKLIFRETEQLVGELSAYQIVVGARTWAADKIASYAVQEPDIWQVAAELVQQPLRIVAQTADNLLVDDLA